MEIQANLTVVKEFIKDAIDLKTKKSKESILRESLAHYMGKMFKEVPWWVRYHILGRERSRPLNARTLANDMGLESPFCDTHISELGKLVEAAFVDNQTYATLIKKLW